MSRTRHAPWLFILRVENALDEALDCADVDLRPGIPMEDVRRNKNRTDRAREAVLDQLAAEAQENGMGYPGR